MSFTADPERNSSFVVCCSLLILSIPPSIARWVVATLFSSASVVSHASHPHRWTGIAVKVKSSPLTDIFIIGSQYTSLSLVNISQCALFHLLNSWPKSPLICKSILSVQTAPQLRYFHYRASSKTNDRAHFSSTSFCICKCRAQFSWHSCWARSMNTASFLGHRQREELLPQREAFGVICWNIETICSLHFPQESFESW